MKPIFALKTAAASLALALCNQTFASVIPVNDWYASGNSNASAAIINGATTSPQYVNIANQNLNFVFSYFNPVTLSAGESISLSFNLTLDLAGDATSKTFTALRLGLFNSSLPHATTASFGEDRVVSSSTTVNGWKGFLLMESPTLFRKTGGTSNYASTNDTDSAAAITGMYNRVFNEGTAYSFSLVFERLENNLLVSGSNGVGNFSTTLANAFSAPGYNVFDAFGLYATATDGVTINNIQFSAVNLTVIPEPSSLALVAVAVVSLASGMRRRKQS